MRTTAEEEILNVFKMLPENKKIEVMDFLSFLSEKIKKENPIDIKKAISSIEETWGSIKLSKNILKHIAEDKDIEYDV